MNNMFYNLSHRRLNILTNEWVLVSPDRLNRPWQGYTENVINEKEVEYKDNCYLCPGNYRANGNKNPLYKSTFVFDNDFSALLMNDKINDNFNSDIQKLNFDKSNLLITKPEKGICRVVCFSPKHNVTLAEMEINEIVEVIKIWQKEYLELGNISEINYVQIFENKGEIMGCSNPHPHGQIWAQNNIPTIPAKEQFNQLKYYKENGTTLLDDYISIERDKKERIVFENDSFITLVPFWAAWPFETLIVAKKKINNILQLDSKGIEDFAEIIKVSTVKYDNLFQISFPYSAGIHQAPTDGLIHDEWHFHMHFYPPLLRSATIRKFMVGYEMLAEPQRDMTPEFSAEILSNASLEHYSSLISKEKLYESENKFSNRIR